jgi:hypothetical protein
MAGKWHEFNVSVPRAVNLDPSFHLSGIVYVQADPAAEPERYLLHKRDKGDPGTVLRSLVYVGSIQLGTNALEEGKRKAAGPASRKASAASGKGRS